MTSDRRTRIEARLREQLAPTHLEVVDESHLHAGHEGARGGQTHYRATIVSPRFAGLSRVEAQRLVYAALTDELGSGLHALALRTLTPEQWQQSG
jgi:BolA protein